MASNANFSWPLLCYHLNLLKRRSNRKLKTHQKHFKSLHKAIGFIHWLPLSLSFFESVHAELCCCWQPGYQEKGHMLNPFKNVGWSHNWWPNKHTSHVWEFASSFNAPVLGQGYCCIWQLRVVSLIGAAKFAGLFSSLAENSQTSCCSSLPWFQLTHLLKLALLGAMGIYFGSAQAPSMMNW